jgi:hypothetical protein
MAAAVVKEHKDKDHSDDDDEALPPLLSPVATAATAATAAKAYPKSTRGRITHAMKLELVEMAIEDAEILDHLQTTNPGTLSSSIFNDLLYVPFAPNRASCIISIQGSCSRPKEMDLGAYGAAYSSMGGKTTKESINNSSATHY